MRGQEHLLRLRMGGYVDGQRRILGDRNIAHVAVTLCDEAPAYGHFSDPENGYTGRFPELEDEMCDFGPDGLSGGRSPDRVDALVWAIHELLPGRSAAPRIRDFG